MKKTLLYSLCSLALAAFALPVWGQQINGDFTEWGNCYPWVAGKYISSAVGTQPKGWHASNVYGANGTGKSDKFVTKVNGHADGCSGVQIQNVFVGFWTLGSWAPGYLSLGTPWNTSKGVGEKDGGCFGGSSFGYRPDAIAFNYKYSKSTSKASFIGYLWKGSWTQNNVPSNTTSVGNPTKASIVDRDVCVLGTYDASKHKGDAPTSSSGAELIASYEKYVETSVDEWTPCEIPFAYKNEEATPEKINVIFASSDYFSVTGAGTDGGSVGDTRDVLTIDDVRLVYYHSLSSCTYNNQDVVFDANNSARIDAPYEKEKLRYDKNGIGASVEESYDSVTGLLTITVKGNDIDANPDSKTVYTVQFIPVANMVVTDVKYGTFFAPFDVAISSVTAYACMSVSNNVLQLQEIKGIIPAFTPVLLKSEEPYASQMTGSLQNNADIYNGDLIVTVAGNSMSAQNTDVSVVNNQDGTINFVLDNFVLEGMGGIGNIHVNGLTKDISGKFSFKGEVTITEGNKEGVESWIGPGLGIVPLNMEGTVKENSLNVSITIDMTSTLGEMGNVQVKLTCEGEPKASFISSIGRYGILTGVLEPTAAPIGSYVLQNQDDNVAFYKVFDGDEYAKPEVPANRCYLIAPASSEAGVKAISFPSDPTAIDAVKDLLSGKSEIYDLEGRRLPALQKGINIVNGKKVMVK